MSWDDLGNQTVAVVQLWVWTGRGERSAAISNDTSFPLFMLLSEWMFLFVVNVTPAVFCFQDLIADPASPSLMLNTAAVWQWGMKPESGAAGCAAVTFCMRLRCYSRNPVHGRVLNAMTMLWKYWLTKPVFKYTEKPTLKREPSSSRAHSGGKGSWPRLAPEISGT